MVIRERKQVESQDPTPERKFQRIGTPPPTEPDVWGVGTLVLAVAVAIWFNVGVSPESTVDSPHWVPKENASTPNYGPRHNYQDFRPLPQHAEADTFGVTFQFKGKHDAHVVLGTQPLDVKGANVNRTTETQDIVYEIIIGGWRNMKSGFRVYQGAAVPLFLEFDSPNIVSDKEFREFTIRFRRDNIELWTPDYKHHPDHTTRPFQTFPIPARYQFPPAQGYFYGICTWETHGDWLFPPQPNKQQPPQSPPKTKSQGRTEDTNESSPQATLVETLKKIRNAKHEMERPHSQRCQVTGVWYRQGQPNPSFLIAANVFVSHLEVRNIGDKRDWETGTAFHYPSTSTIFALLKSPIHGFVDADCTSIRWSNGVKWMKYTTGSYTSEWKGNHTFIMGAPYCNPRGTICMEFQTDGNLVINGDDTIVWESGTANQGCVKAVFTDDSRLLLLRANGDIVWGANLETPFSGGVLRLDYGLEILDSNRNPHWALPEGWYEVGVDEDDE